MKLISFDPSSGSRQSMPAAALFTIQANEAELLEVVRIELDHAQKPHIRLNQLFNALLDLREEWQPDEFAVEYIAPKIHRAVPVNLHRSVGVIQAAFGDLPYHEIRPQIWHRWLAREGVSYEKSDELDAILIGVVACEKILQGELDKSILGD